MCFKLLNVSIRKLIGLLYYCRKEEAQISWILVQLQCAHGSFMNKANYFSIVVTLL